VLGIELKDEWRREGMSNGAKSGHSDSRLMSWYLSDRYEIVVGITMK
jgi:hypothetical protein